MQADFSLAQPEAPYPLKNEKLPLVGGNKNFIAEILDSHVASC
jgi:hypothetical protein